MEMGQLVKARQAASRDNNAKAVEELDRMIKAKTTQIKRTGAGHSAMRGAVQSSTFNLADEFFPAMMAIPGAMQTGDSIPDAYRGIKESWRNLDDSAESANPNAYLGGELAGSVVPGMAAFKGAKMLPNMTKMNSIRPAGALALTGGAGGAASGYGASEDEDLGEQAKDALLGGTIGAIAAPALGVVGEKAGEFVLGAGSTMMRKLFSSPESVSRRLIQEDLLADGYRSADDVIEAVNKTPDTVLADLGPSVGQDAIVASKQQGPGRKIAHDFVNDRQRGQQDRIEDAIVGSVQPKWGNYNEFISDVTKARKEQSDPLYKTAYSEKFEPTEEILALQNNTFVREALETAKGRLDIRLPSKELDDGLPGNKLELFDKAKQVMDDRIFAAMKDQPALARDYIKIKNAWVKELDDLVPSYKEARGVYAGAKQMENAADFGRGVLRNQKMFADDLDEVLKDFGPGEMDAFRIGIVRGMVDKLEGAKWSHDSGSRVFNSTRAEKLIQKAYPDGQAGLLKEVIETESARSAFRNRVVGGSPTMENLAAQDRLEMARHEGVGSMAMDFVRRIVNENINPDKLSPGDYEKVAEKLFGKISDDEIRSIFSSTWKRVGDDSMGPISGRLGATAGIYGGGESEELNLVQ